MAVAVVRRGGETLAAATFTTPTKDKFPRRAKTSSSGEPTRNHVQFHPHGCLHIHRLFQLLRHPSPLERHPTSSANTVLIIPFPFARSCTTCFLWFYVANTQLYHMIVFSRNIPERGFEAKGSFMTARAILYFCCRSFVDLVPLQNREGAAYWVSPALAVSLKNDKLLVITLVLLRQIGLLSLIGWHPE